MRTPDQPVLRDIVLIGGGHSHVGVLKRFAMNWSTGARMKLGDWMSIPLELDLTALLDPKLPSTLVKPTREALRSCEVEGERTA